MDFKIGPALWKTSEYDLPIEIIRYHRSEDGITYAYTAGGTYIPVSEISWPEVSIGAHLSDAKAESELVGVTDIQGPLREAGDKVKSAAVKAAENLGQELEDFVPTIIKEILPTGKERLAIGTVGGILALLGGSYLVDRYNNTQHLGRAKRSEWAHSLYGAGVGVGAAVGTLYKTGSPLKAAAAMGAGVLAGNVLYDYKYKHGDLKTSIAKNAIVGATSFMVYTGIRPSTHKAINAIKIQAARMMSPSQVSALSQLKLFKDVSPLLSNELTPLLLTAASVPVAHSIITRSLARSSQKLNANHSIAPSIIDNQAGRYSTIDYRGPLSGNTAPVVDVNIGGSIRSHYNTEQIKRQIG